MFSMKSIRFMELILYDINSLSTMSDLVKISVDKLWKSRLRLKSKKYKGMTGTRF